MPQAPQAGHFDYQGRWTQQHTAAFIKLAAFIADEESSGGAFARIIEIGTGAGGLAKWLGNTYPAKDIHTLDLNAPSVPIGLSNVTQHIDDVDNGPSNVLITLIADGGRCLVLCDGGNKLQEVNGYRSHLKTSDIILAHDCIETVAWAADPDWSWDEIHATDVLTAMSGRRILTRIASADLHTIAWMGFRVITI